MSIDEKIRQAIADDDMYIHELVYTKDMIIVKIKSLNETIETKESVRQWNEQMDADIVIPAFGIVGEA